jgi:hypothetical protein
MSKPNIARSTVKEMMMKNVLRALALVAVGTVSLAASANAMPGVSSVAGLGEQASASVEQVGYNGRHHGGHHRFYGHRYWGGGHYYGYGDGFSWKRYCYYHPYHWKCRHSDY